MALTRQDTVETKIIFKLQDDDGNTTTRSLVIPGVPEITGSAPPTEFTTAFDAFREGIVEGKISGRLQQFIQPANWRDNTGATGTASIAAAVDPYTTIDITAEFTETTKRTYSVGE